jgi:hypothetical protein
MDGWDGELGLGWLRVRVMMRCGNVRTVRGVGFHDELS